ncbi:MAG: helix-turn-helix domain-containing protein [Pseudomonadota bacterium]|nr:helix-turn-helix domain-containing protein [Pseudomonadota bacterium]
METPKPKVRFVWTEQCQRIARLLHAMGYSDPQIAQRLGCNRSTIAKHIGRKRDRAELSRAELQALFEQFETQRDMEALLTAYSGSTEQARLRTSFRLRRSRPGPAGRSDGDEQEDRDERIRREVEALVRHPIFDQDGAQSD